MAFAELVPENEVHEAAVLAGIVKIVTIGGINLLECVVSDQR